MNITKFLRTAILKNICEQLLLSFCKAVFKIECAVGLLPMGIFNKVLDVLDALKHHTPSLSDFKRINLLYSVNSKEYKLINSLKIA